MELQRYVTHVMQDQYGRSPGTLIDLQHYQDPRLGSLYHMYRASCDGGETVIVQTYHDHYARRAIFTWSSQQAVSAWVEGRAALLAALANSDYPAPRVVATRTGSLTCRCDSWTVLLTSYVEGAANDASLQTLSLVGATLGRLHRLSLPSNAPPSWWTPATITHALERLNTVLPLVPLPHLDLHGHFQAVLETILACSDLPQTFIHGDCWLPNAMRTGERVILVDWEFAGRGAALLDLGSLLLMAQCSEKGDLPAQMLPERVVALADGYRAQRSLQTSELPLLLDAIRFSIAWRGAITFARVQEEGWHAGIERLLGRAQRGYCIAEPIAHLAASRFLQSDEHLV
jgi:Ser/Thr protein kinase RdoA (MazF antagonist)